MYINILECINKSVNHNDKIGQSRNERVEIMGEICTVWNNHFHENSNHM